MTTITRRRLLQTAAGGAVLGATASIVDARLAGARAPDAGALVVVFLRGGLDGCSVVVPADERRYYDARPTIAIPPGEALDLDGRFGLHPAMGAVHREFRKGRVAFIPAAGSSDGTRSHFDQQDFVERGGEPGARSGWLSRHLETLVAPRTSPVRALSLTGNLPTSLSGPSGAVAAGNLRSFGLRGFPSAHRDATRRSLETLYGSERVRESTLGRAASDLFAAIDVIDDVDFAGAQPRNDAEYPASGLGRTLEQLAVLVHRRVGLSVATVDVGGWDTHASMGTFAEGSMRTKLTDLSESLGAFVTDLGAAMDRVTVLVHSEFGRRLAENGSRGVDHGRGGLMTVVGNRIKGGVYGEWPGLEPDDLDRGDVAVANDFRNVCAEVLAGAIGNPDIATVFPSLSPRPLGFAKR